MFKLPSKQAYDLTNKIYGRLLVLRPIKQYVRGSPIIWECVCSCGQQCYVTSKNLLRGSTKSCGCLLKESRLKNSVKFLEAVRKHGMCRTVEYQTWRRMNSRCYNPKNPRYVYYGARGITVCNRWRHDFLNFYKDMGVKPKKELSLDRINNDGNYEPQNCRWATVKQQNNNKRARYSVKKN